MEHTSPPRRRAPRPERLPLSIAAIAAALVAAPFVARLTPLAIGRVSAEAAGAVAELPVASLTKVAHLTQAAQSVAGTGSHLGFDTHTYPGDAAMQAFRGRYDWVGFYLPAPCHRETSWSGKRDNLARMN
jgi:hypothetical protein